MQKELGKEKTFANSILPAIEANNAEELERVWDGKFTKQMEAFEEYIVEKNFNEVARVLIGKKAMSLRAIIKKGNLEMLRKLWTDGQDNTILDLAIKSENLGIIKFLCRKGLKPNPTTVEHITLNGNARIFEFLWDYGYTPTDTQKFMNTVTEKGLISTFDFLLSRGIMPSEESFRKAIARGHRFITDSMAIYAKESMPGAEKFDVNAYNTSPTDPSEVSFYEGTEIDLFSVEAIERVLIMSRLPTPTMILTKEELRKSLHKIYFRIDNDYDIAYLTVKKIGNTFNCLVGSIYEGETEWGTDLFDRLIPECKKEKISKITTYVQFGGNGGSVYKWLIDHGFEQIGWGLNKSGIHLAVDVDKFDALRLSAFKETL